MDIYDWLAVVERCVPSRKERAVVRMELFDHYSDREAALLDAGMEPRQAAKKALDAMGDPDETGRLLRAVHNPWLGRLLVLARILLILAVIVGLFHMTDLKDFVSNQISLRRELARYRDVRAAFSEENPAAVRVGTCETEARLGDYRITVWAAGECSTADYFTAVDPFEQEELYVVLRFAAPPWRTAENVQFWLEDELGGVYQVDYYGALNRGLPIPDRRRTGMQGEDEGNARLQCQWLGQDLTASYYLLIIKGSVDAESWSGADRAEVHVWMGGEERVLPVTLGPREIIGEPFDPATEDVDAIAETMLGELGEKATGATLSLREGAADPVSRGGFEVWVPRARERFWLKAPSDGETGKGTPLSREEWEALTPEEQAASGQTVVGKFEYVIALRGPLERLPLTKAELDPLLTLTGAEGTAYPLRGTAAIWDGATFLRWHCRRQDLIVFDLYVYIEDPSEVYTLTCTLDGETFPLRIVMEEEAGQ